MSGLPVNDTPWPLPGHEARYVRMRTESAWYGGSPKLLTEVYGGANSHAVPDAGVGTEGANRVMRAVRAGLRSLWGTPVTEGQEDTRRHLPTAQDIAIISSELLYSEPPRFIVDGPVHEVDVFETTAPETAPGTEAVAPGEPKLVHKAGDPTDDTIKTQERLDYILDGCNFHATLLAAGETGSALGSSALRIAWNKNGMTKDRPVITRVDADATFPDYVWGQLEGVIFWHVVPAATKDAGAIYRHLELHEGGKIYHGLYRGEADTLGKAVPLTYSPATKDLAVDEDGALRGAFFVDPAGNPVATAVSIPNMLPDPLDRKNNVGRSDYTEAVMDLLDAGDRLYTHMLESEEDGKSRLLIARSLLETKGAGQGLGFDTTQRAFHKVNMPPSADESGKMPIEQIEFELRLAEYWAAIEAFYDRTIKAAGYNPQTMGTDDQAVAQTATEYAGKNKRSMSTRDKKIRYAQPMLEALLTGLLVVDRDEFASGITPYPVRVEFPDAIQPTFEELLNGGKLMKEVGLAMVDIIKHVYPELTDTEADAMATRIKSSTAVIDPITLGLGGRGVGNDDGI